MKKLTRYIFTQLFFTTLVGTLVLTCIMWLAQSLRYIDFIANKGVPLLVFLEMIAYLLPNLVVIVVPIAVLIAVIFIYNKLIVDHELIVMQTSGMSPWQLAKPALLVGILFSLILYAFTLHFLPLSFRKYRDISLSLREKSLSSLIQIGQFNSLGKYTVYAKGQDSNGHFRGVLIYDGNEGEKSITFTAEKGILFDTEENSRLHLINGTRQEQELSTGKPSVLYFENYNIETKDKSASDEKGDRFLRAYERTVGDLLNPDQSLSTAHRLEFMAAAHQRILSPLYALIFALIGVCSLILGYYNRSGRTKKIMIACSLASLLEVCALVFLNTLKYASFMIPLSYGLVGLTFLTCLILLTPLGNRLSGLLRLRRAP